MANTRFTVKCGATGGEIVYYGDNCPREGEWIADRWSHLALELILCRAYDLRTGPS